MKSLVSPTVIGLDAGEHADLHLVDACYWGSPPIKTWSRTQALVSLSSAEAELYAAIKACSETLGFLSLLKDYQIHATGKIMCDASAALGIIKRQGLGRTRHIHTSYLWIQQVNERGINFNKVTGSENCADLFTKPLTRESAEHLSELIGMEFPDGHDEIAFTINFVGHSGQLIPSSLRSSLQDLGLSGAYFISTRMDLESKCFRTSSKGGPPWKDVEARVTLDASTGRVIETEPARDITRERAASTITWRATRHYHAVDLDESNDGQWSDFGVLGSRRL